MSSNKRLNENAQIQKEEYDAKVENATEIVAGSFQRATEATLKQRRVIQLRSPIAPPPADKLKPNVFGGITLQGGTSASFTKQQAMQDDKFSKKSLQLVDSFKTEVMKAPLNSNWLDLMMQYVRYDNKLYAERKRAAPPSYKKSSAAVATTTNNAAAAAPTPTTGGISFGAAPASAAPPAKTNDNATTTHQSSGDEWIELQTFEPVRMFRNKDLSDPQAGWAQFCTGKLIFQQDRHNASARRMLMRDSAGIKVHVNISLRGGLVFTRNDSPNPKTKKLDVRIVFRATNDPTRGPENFLMRPTAADADALERTVRELAKD